MPLALFFCLEQRKIALFNRFYLFGRGVRAFQKFFLFNVKGLPSRIGELAKNNPKKFSRFLF